MHLDCKTKRDAVVRGKRLARSLGPQWKFIVWKGMGWHYRAYVLDGLLYVADAYDHKGRLYYYAMLTDDRNIVGCGSIHWSINPSNYTTPQKAITAVLRRAKIHIRELNELYNDVEEAVKG
jgi:hypothetical protein